MKFLVFSEKVLTKPLRYDIIKKLPQRGGAQSADKRLVEKKKNFEKPLDKACAMWYNVIVVRKRAQKAP
ncbi:MAG: hypothetical protein KIG62_05775 [Oscillospiraceae bacterium]|nr:hypothetical protein [Oscillospiraceae bacterium]